MCFSLICQRNNDKQIQSVNDRYSEAGRSETGNLMVRELMINLFIPT